MPTYKYHCKACRAEPEKLQKITDEPLKICPVCGEEALQRGPGGGVGLSFQGSGFYITDYKDDKVAKTECCPCGKNKNSCDTKKP